MKFLLASLILVIGALEPSSAFVTQRLRSVSHSQSELSANRKPFITGNWKLNPDTRQEAVELATGVANAVRPSTPGDVAIFVPFPFLEAVQKTVGDKLIVGAEVSSWESLPLEPADNLTCLNFGQTLFFLSTLHTDDNTRRGGCLYWRNLRSDDQKHGYQLGIGWSLGAKDY